MAEPVPTGVDTLKTPEWTLVWSPLSGWIIQEVTRAGEFTTRGERTAVTVVPKPLWLAAESSLEAERARTRALEGEIEAWRYERDLAHRNTAKAEDALSVAEARSRELEDALRRIAARKPFWPKQEPSWAECCEIARAALCGGDSEQ